MGVFARVLFSPLWHLSWLFVAGLLLLLDPAAEHLDCFSKHPAAQKESVCVSSLTRASQVESKHVGEGRQRNRNPYTVFT